MPRAAWLRSPRRARPRRRRRRRPSRLARRQPTLAAWWPVPMTSERLRSPGTCSSETGPGTTTRVPSASGARTRSPWPPSANAPFRSLLPHGLPFRHEVLTPLRQFTHVLSEMWNGAITKSPTAILTTSSPTASTTPTNSWPMRRGARVGVMPRYGQRSEPQTQALTTLTIASSPVESTGSGTVSTRMSRGA